LGGWGNLGRAGPPGKIAGRARAHTPPGTRLLFWGTPNLPTPRVFADGWGTRGGAPFGEARKRGKVKRGWGQGPRDEGPAAAQNGCQTFNSWEFHLWQFLY